MSDLAVEALAAAVKHASSADATEVVSVAQQFYAFLNNPGGATTTLAAAVVPQADPASLGATPLENGQPVSASPSDTSEAASPAPEAEASPAPEESPADPQGSATVTPMEVTAEPAPQ